jgi:geranylgeranyl diphosphate synthase type II
VPEPFAADRASIDRHLDDVCATHLAGLPSTVSEAIRYGLKSPGKRIRPLLVVFAYRAAGGKGDVFPLACAPEVIHSYSLMHDDLPCMDDDDMRRGRPTVHKVHGTRVAIVAGVVMIGLAAAVARDGARALGLSDDVVVRILDALLSAAGANGMIGGQQQDLAGEGLPLDLDQREAVHSAKTGALIVGSIRLGALAAGASGRGLAALEHYGRAIGLAFQIMDDVLDVTSTSSVLGKTTGRDAVLGKSSYPAALGIDGARRRAEALISTGMDTLRREGMLTQDLSQLANFMVTRTT